MYCVLTFTATPIFDISMSAGTVVAPHRIDTVLVGATRTGYGALINICSTGERAVYKNEV